jgi:glucose-1-phosphate thymidylyltransferase
VKCLILAAGYGTRMQSVIGDRPKALVDIQGHTVLDRLVADIRDLCPDITLVSNARFHAQFTDWQQQHATGITVLNDGSTHAGNRLGAVGDIAFAIDAAGIDDDLLILAADNLLTFSVEGMISAFRQREAVHLAVWTNPNIEDQRRRGVVTVNAEQRVVSFVEKPTQPGSSLAAAPIYILPRDLLGTPRSYLSAGGNPDAPGHLMAHLVERVPMWAWPIPGEVLDVGNPDSYQQAITADLSG